MFGSGCAMRLAVNEVFETFQGKAFYTGTPAIFIRLQGCDVGCPWCDTKHTWALDPKNERPMKEVLEKTNDAPTYALVEPAELAELVRAAHRDTSSLQAMSRAGST